MSENSKIEWTDHTFNPWIGCTKVSPGCAHCYAERREDLRLHRVKWGAGQPRQRTSAANWKLPVKWNAQPWICDACGMAHAVPGAICMTPGCDCETKHRARVFCASLADVFDDEVDPEWLYDLLALIHKTPNLTWLLLTKRPENWESRLRAAAAQCTIDPLDITDRIHSWLDARSEWSRIPHNVWIGTTVEDQVRADERIPALLAIPAKVRFLSCEPLLGPVQISQFFYACTSKDDALIDWVICGGESGPQARPMHPDWARGLRDQCDDSSGAFLFKQWGEWVPLAENFDTTKLQGLPTTDSHYCQWADRGFAEPRVSVRVGKKAAGRLLDGIEHNAFPV